ncbi:MAG: histone H1, partial [Nitrospirae bacterium CG02_land_8_20_14_3_00_44_33]
PAPVEKKAEPAKKAPKVTQVTGEIKAVDAAAKTITVVKKVKGQDKETVISVDDKTLADVKVGDKVKAKYTTADGKNTAKSVIKKTAAAKKAAPAKKAPAAGY